MCKNHIGNRRKKIRAFWISKILDFQNSQVCGSPRTFQKHGFGVDWDPQGSKLGFEGIPRQGIARQSCWRGWRGHRRAQIYENRGDPGRIFRLFPKWPGMAPNGPKWLWGYYLGVRGAWGPIIWPCLAPPPGPLLYAYYSPVWLAYYSPVILQQRNPPVVGIDSQNLKNMCRGQGCSFAPHRTAPDNRLDNRLNK